MSFDSVSRSDPSDFKLGEWWVRVHRRELERPGETVSVEARSFDVLVCLARHAPAVVPKQRLLEEVWTDSPYVGDDVISHAIWDLRRALGDSAKQPDYIQTVPRKGYRLVAEVLRPQGAALPVEGARIGHYDLGSELGRGSMGVVFGATDRRLGRRVAVKFLAPELTRDPKACRRFEREARLAASLDHPNLGTVHEVGETTQGYKYLVSAFYGGGSLKDLLAAGPPPLEEAVRLVRQLVAGLGAAHRRDIVHRDIKPANLLLDEHGTLKICDFGIAKLLGGTDLTQTGSTLGTPAYKSPEQALGHGVDHRTDLWSVGVVCFELLTGRRPFEGDFEQAVVQSILSEQPRDLEDPERRPIPDDLKSFVLKALAKDPAERFQTAEEMGLALDALGQREAPEVSGPRKKWGRGVAALLGVFLLGAVAMLGRSSLDRPESALPSALASSKEAAVRPVERILIDARRTWIRQGSDSLTLESVRRELDRAREIAPESSDVHAYLAIFHASRYAVGWQPEEKAAAVSSAGRIGEGDERYPTALAALAWVAWTDGSSLDQALDWAEESVRLEPLCGEDGLCDFHYYVLGSLQIRMDDEEAGLQTLRDGILVGGGAVQCRLKLAVTLEDLEKPDEAEEVYRELRSGWRENSTVQHEFATFLFNRGRYREAGQEYKGVHDKTRDPKAALNFGHAHYMMESWDTALDSYDVAMEGFAARKEANPTPFVSIGDVYMEKDQPAAAEKYYRRALEVFAEEGATGVQRLAQRAVCLAKLGDFEEAERAMTTPRSNQSRFQALPIFEARIAALEKDRVALLEIARGWIDSGGEPIRLIDDAAFISFREDQEYLRILWPDLYQELGTVGSTALPAS